MIQTMQGLLGIVVFISIAYFLSSHRSQVRWKLVLMGLGLQWTLALLVLGIPRLGWSGPLQFFFQHANQAILAVLRFTDVGSQFLLGDLARPEQSGFILVFQVLPIIIFLSSLMTLLYHLGLMQLVVNSFAWLMQKTLRLSGAESLAAAANVFVGQTEAPLVIKPYLKNMTSSELFALMTGGMATIAGSVLAAYVGILKDVIPNIGGHLLTASILAAPAAVVIAKLMVPETQVPETLGSIPNNKEKEYVNSIEAAAHGAGEGMKLAINVAAMLLAFIALIALADAMLIYMGDLFGFSTWGSYFFSHQSSEPLQLSLTLILSVVFKPIAFLIGLPLGELGVGAGLLGKKIVFNEFIAYLDLAQLREGLSERSLIILSYGLCGFANFSSIAIQLGGIGPLIPERRKELARFGLRTVIGGNLAAFTTAALAGILI
jgi:concentrative nucleoside transporter, CNT family